MAINVTKLAAMAKRLIEANGLPMTFTRLSRTPADPTKPWNGPSLDTHAAIPRIDYTGIKAVRDQTEFADLPETTGAFRQNFAGGGIKVPLREVIYVAESSFPDGHIDLKTLDEINDGALTWRVAYMMPVAPGATEIIYMIWVEG